ncbi:KilA-N domain-containing protein [Massilia antarctica]|uniref:KilA-N domain-containing protein n=1 Tax=Massilia antarctica TaxID=2765360 RepID=UPI00226D8EB9|nr:KilA-N domain-containing protein [Massilia sp. H27-R4]MCY0913226.1 KilA-N domain-containing protein [Massilia sp. H27-R4]
MPATSAAVSLITAEYQGMAFNFQADGWFNATFAAKKYGKRPGDWLDLAETQDYIGALDALSNTSPNGNWHKTKRGANGGTWLHPKLAVRFAQWLDMRFAVWCDMQIDEILRRPAIANDDAEISTVSDRAGLLFSALGAVVQHHLRFDTVYRAINAVAGSSNFRFMTKAQVRTAEPVAHRIAMGAATANDWRLIELSGSRQPAAKQGKLSFSPGE